MTYVPVCRLSDLVGTGAHPFTVSGVEVALVYTDETVFAIRDECSHQSYVLSDGEVVDCTIECEAHGSRFDLRTGQPQEPPAIAAVPVYPVEIIDGQVHIDLDNPLVSQES